MVLRVFIPTTITVARKWLDEYKKHNSDLHYIIVNEDFKTLSLEELCIDVAQYSDLDEIVFCYPENGKTPEQIGQFVEYAVSTAKHVMVSIITVSSWVVHFLNLYIYIGEMTSTERKEVAEKYHITEWIRFDDTKVFKLVQTEDKTIDTEPLPLLHHVPVQYDFDLNDEMTERLTSLFIALDLIYNENRKY
jgi:hypothetical protein